MLRVGILSDAPAVLTANKTLALRNKYSWAKFEDEYQKYEYSRRLSDTQCFFMYLLGFSTFHTDCQYLL